MARGKQWFYISIQEMSNCVVNTDNFAGMCRQVEQRDRDLWQPSKLSIKGGGTSPSLACVWLRLEIWAVITHTRVA